MKKALIIAAAAALVGGFHEWSPAYGDVSHYLGSDGPIVKLDASCHRAVVAPPGETLEMDVNVTGQQVHCLIRRPDPFARCVKHLGPAPQVAKGHTHPDGTSDWSNVDKVASYQASIYECSKAHL